MNLNREINLNKKFLVLLMLVNIIGLGLYYSYALFQVNVIKNNVIVINTGTINLTVATGKTNNTFTLQAGASETLTVSLTTTNLNEIGYKLYYTAESTSLEFQSPTQFANDIIQGTFTTSTSFPLTIRNTGSSSITITIGGKGGLAAYPVNLDSGQHEIILTSSREADKVLAAANAKSSTCPTKIVEDDITYISGSYGCIDFNYVWYSGKMWRITAIYPDGSMKLVTDSLMTTISYNTNYTDYDFYTDISDNSVIYQWLNEDFLDGIYNEGNGIIDTTKYWNATAVNNYNVKPTETDMISSSDALVGLLNTYEYYKSYQNATNSLEAYGYLYNGLQWWKLNDNLSLQGNNNPYENSYGVRPAIYINSSIQFKSGTGSKSDPYIINGDKTVGQANDLVNTRIPGEYVKFRSDDSASYRIVSIDNSLTKLVDLGGLGPGYDQIDEISQYGYPLTLGTAFGNQNYQASYVCGDNCPDGLDVALESYYGSGIYSNYSFNYTNKLAYGDYYMGEVPLGESYKLGICTTDTSTTKTCTKADSVNLIAGILRYGELFAAYSTDGIKYQELYTLYGASGVTAGYTPVWLMTPQDSYSGFWSIEDTNVGGTGYIGNDCTSPEDYEEGLCSFDKKTAFPTIYLKSTIKIVSGSGTEQDPYIIT